MGQIVIDLSKRPEKLEIFRGGEGMPIEDMIYENFGFDDESAESIAVEEIPSETITVEEARAEIQKAYDQGFADGKQVSTGTYSAELNRHREWIQNFDSIVIGLRSQFADQTKELEGSVVALATVIAEHILQYEVDKSPSNIALHQAKKALQNLRSTDKVRIRLHPSNIEALKDAHSTLLSENSNLRQIEFIEDEMVSPAGCIAESSIGTIDAQLATQLMKMRETLSQVGIDEENPLSEVEQILEDRQEEKNISPQENFSQDIVVADLPSEENFLSAQTSDLPEENFNSSDPGNFSLEENFSDEHLLSDELPPAEENFLLPGSDDDLDNLGFDNFSFDENFPDIDK